MVAHDLFDPTNRAGLLLGWSLGNQPKVDIIGPGS